jgi:hypothetical protein
MHVLIDRVIGRCTVADVGVGDEANILENLESAVDGREIYAGSRALHLNENCLGGAVTKRLDCF